MQRQVPDARMILLEAFEQNPQSEQIWLAAAKLEWENNEFVRARALFARARERVPSERVFLKSALLERELNEVDNAIVLLNNATHLFPKNPKFYLMAAQILDQERNINDDTVIAQFASSVVNNILCRPTKAPKTGLSVLSKQVADDKKRARNYLLAGLKFLPNCVPLWLALIRLEERVKGPLRARPTAEMARTKNNQSTNKDLLWVESVRVERRAGEMMFAENLLALALQECPQSPALWAESLLHCTATQQRQRATEALRRCTSNNTLVQLAIARLFERSAHSSKARRWYTRVTASSPQLGDGWVFLFAFEFVDTFKERLVREGVQGEKQAIDCGGLDAIDGDDEKDDNCDPTKENEQDASLVSFDRVEGLRRIAMDCETAQPNSGELWCSIAKDTYLRRKSVREILIMTTEAVLGFELYIAVKQHVLS
jgi:pre-mRNA-processing factor 6